MKNTDLTPDQKAALEALASMPAADIDTSEIPEKKAFLKPRLVVAMRSSRCYGGSMKYHSTNGRFL